MQTERDKQKNDQLTDHFVNDRLRRVFMFEKFGRATCRPDTEQTKQQKNNQINRVKPSRNLFNRQPFSRRFIPTCASNQATAR